MTDWAERPEGPGFANRSAGSAIPFVTGYCSFADIKKLLPEESIIQLTDDENMKPDTIDETKVDHAPMVERINEAIETADDEINGYCAVKYAVPLSPVPGVINKLSVELAIYYLYSRRNMVGEKIEKRYDKAVARLKDIARGVLTLGTDPTPVASSAMDSAATNKVASDRVFTREKLRGF